LPQIAAERLPIWRPCATNGGKYIDISDTVFEWANRRTVSKKAAFPAVVLVRYDRRVACIVISLASGLELAFSPKHA